MGGDVNDSWEATENCVDLEIPRRIFNICPSYSAKRLNHLFVANTGGFRIVAASATRLELLDESSHNRQIPQSPIPRINLSDRLPFEQMRPSEEAFKPINTPNLTTTLEPLPFDSQRYMQLANSPTVKLRFENCLSLDMPRLKMWQLDYFTIRRWATCCYV